MPNLKNPKSKKNKKINQFTTQVKSQKLPNSYRIFLSSVNIFKTNWRVLGGITLVYALLSVFLVQTSTNVASQLQGDATALEQASHRFSNLLGGFSTGDSIMQLVLFLIVSLATVWAIRRLVAGEGATVKQSYYLGMTPLVPVIILLALFFIQLLPMMLTSAGLQLALAGSLKLSVLEAIAWFAIFGLGSAWTLYMISKTMVAIFIVSLPGMTPKTALKKAKDKVAGQRFSIIRKLIFLPFAVLTMLGVVLIPIIMIASGLAGPVFLILGPLSLTFSIVYLFILYQAVINHE